MASTKLFNNTQRKGNDIHAHTYIYTHAPNSSMHIHITLIFTHMLSLILRSILIIHSLIDIHFFLHFCYVYYYTFYKEKHTHTFLFYICRRSKFSVHMCHHQSGYKDTTTEMFTFKYDILSCFHRSLL